MTFAADSVSATPFRGGSATLNPPLGHSKAREKKSCFMLKITPHPPLSRATFLAAARSRSGSDSPRAVIHSPRAASLPAGEGSLSAFSFAKAAAKEKAIKKKSADGEISRSAERDKGDLPLTSAPSPKGARKLQFGGRKL